MAGSTARPRSSPAGSASTCWSSARCFGRGATTWRREIRLIRALADEGYQFTLNEGVPPIPRDKMTTIASLPEHLAHRLMDEIEAGGVPVVMLRGDGQMNPDGIRDYDLLVPTSVELLVRERYAEAAAGYEREAQAWREAFIAEHGVIPPPSHP